MVTAAGYSLEYIDEMDFFRAQELMRYWAQYPPVHLQLKALIAGDKKKGRPTPSELESAAESGAFIPGRGQDGSIPFGDIPKEIQDWLKETSTHGK